MKKTESLNGQLSRIITELVSRGVTLEQAKREFEKMFIVASLKSNDGNLGRSAKSLGVHRNTLRNKVGTLDILSSDYSPPTKMRRARRGSGGRR